MKPANRNARGYAASTTLNPEKQRILECAGNILVTANPGTGKTLLLAHKYLDLIKQGKKPEDILCLTFTVKARQEMERRIIGLLAENGIKTDPTKLNIFTFHAYCMEHLGEDTIVSTNLLRFVIYRYLKDHEIVNYSDDYLVEDFVPKIENGIRYLKSFGILPETVNLAQVKALLEPYAKYSKEELGTFAEAFLDIFAHYEERKRTHGMDYADLLIQFLALKSYPQFSVVLVDELQDVNTMEAEIALRSGKAFFAVGDKKQAIFGFQGGSMLNFSRFKGASFVLSENFRSTDEILRYAKSYIEGLTQDDSIKKELRDLKSSTGKKGAKPIVYEVENKKMAWATACQLVKELAKTEKQVAVIARTNGQIAEVAKALTREHIPFSTTFFSASGDARRGIVDFLRGLISVDIKEIKHAMFTPFFPLSLQEAFLLGEDTHLTIESLGKRCPAFLALRKSATSVPGIGDIFEHQVFPIAVAHGKEYLFAAVKLQKALGEAFRMMEDMTMENLLAYLNSADLLEDLSEVEKGVVLTTIHKAKGKEFDTVVYLPQRSRNSSGFLDKIVEAILCAKEIDIEEELEEEELRINFVAMTRAKDKLLVVTDRAAEYLNKESVRGELDSTAVEAHVIGDGHRRAYSLFVNGSYSEAKALLEHPTAWLREHVADHFRQIDHLSVTGLENDAYEYLKRRVLRLDRYSPAMRRGSEVHEIARRLCLGKEVPEFEGYVRNIREMIAVIMKKYPTLESAEEKLQLPLNRLIGGDEELVFEGKLDAVFHRGGEYLIVDWKTDKVADYGAGHREQLAVYRRLFALAKKVPEERVKVAIGYVGLTGRINIGEMRWELDERQPQVGTFDKVVAKIRTILAWREDVDAFFRDMASKEVDEALWRSVVGEWGRERG